MFQKIIELSDFAHSFILDKDIAVLTGNSLQVYDTETYAKKIEKKIFGEYGLSRGLLADNTYFYVKDFIFLYVIKRESLEVIEKIKLGSDLKSDICGMTQDIDNIYAGIRNGSVVKIKKENWKNIEKKDSTNSSIWDMQVWNNKILAGNVKGDILRIDAETLNVDKEYIAHKKNAKSIVIDGRYMVTAGQDLTFFVWDLENFEIVKTKKSAHKKAFQIAGITKKKIITISYSCGEIKVWDLETLHEDNVISIQKCLSGTTIINENDMYMTSRAVCGLEKVSIDNIIEKKN